MGVTMGVGWCTGVGSRWGWGGEGKDWCGCRVKVQGGDGERMEVTQGEGADDDGVGGDKVEHCRPWNSTV